MFLHNYRTWIIHASLLIVKTPSLPARNYIQLSFMDIFYEFFTRPAAICLFLTCTLNKEKAVWPTLLMCGLWRRCLWIFAQPPFASWCWVIALHTFNVVEEHFQRSIFARVCTIIDRNEAEEKAVWNDFLEHFSLHKKLIILCLRQEINKVAVKWNYSWHT